MVGELTTGKWKSSGISILWDGEKLSEICGASEILSIRSFFHIEMGGWPANLPSHSGNAIVIAGLDTCIDVLSPEDAITWMEQELYPKLRSFQMEYENQAALIFWLPSGKKRIKEIASESSYGWLHWDNKTHIPLSRCLWNGAEKDAKKITNFDKDGCEWLGLYHPRIS